MEEFRDISLLRTNELQVTRDGLFWPSYEVTDGQFCYGKIDHPWRFRKNTLFRTAKGNWTMQRQGLFSRTWILYNPANETAGTARSEIWKRKVSLVLNNGFEATLLKKRIFSWSYTWTSMQQGDIMNIETNLWRINTPLTVVLTTASAIAIAELPLLILLGIHFVLLRKGGKK
ncbi:hypothetical protein BH09BAC6_BH09BAC6_02750 [soil metagenome]|jgi:hypothetical protein